MQEYEERLKIEQFNAWHIAAYVGLSFNGDKLPDLNDILTKPLFGPQTVNPRRELTEEEKYNMNRNMFMKFFRIGEYIPESIIVQYNIK